MNARRVMLGVGAGAATVLALQTGALFGALGAPMTSDGRTYDPSKFTLSIGGNFAGFVTQMQGGFATGDVVSEKIGSDYFVKKHIAGVKYEAFSFKTGPNISRAEWDWIRASQNGEYGRRDGAFHVADFSMNEVRCINFYNALVTEIAFPVLDGSSKDTAEISVKLQPEEVKYLQGDGKAISVPSQSQMKKWVASSFRVMIDGLTTTHVNKVDSFAFKQNVIDAAIGTVRDPVKMPTQISTTNLKITLSDADAAPVMTWVQQVNAAGANKQPLAKNGAVVLFDATMQHEIARITFSGLLPVAVTAMPVDAKGDQVHRITLEMTVGKAILTPAPDTVLN